MYICILKFPVLCILKASTASSQSGKIKLVDYQIKYLRTETSILYENLKNSENIDKNSVKLNYSNQYIIIKNILKSIKLYKTTTILQHFEKKLCYKSFTKYQNLFGRISKRLIWFSITVLHVLFIKSLVAKARNS